MNLQPSIFKAYDIRGAYPQDVNESVAHGLGLAFGALALAAAENTVAVGRDGRLSSPALAAALMQGLLAAGVEVLDLGAVTTPMLYFAAATLCRSGIAVTGSHNPRDDNGFKLVLACRSLHGDAVQALYRAMQTMPDTGARAAPQPGRLRQVDVAPAYSARITADVQLARPLRIVVDCGHGIAGASAPALLRALGCQVTALYSEVDGRFPQHHPDPSRPENLRDLIAAVQAEGAELGLAFDGDGDRLGVVTPQGEIVDPDRLLILFARDVLARVPGAPVVFDVKCSQRLAQAIGQAGGVPQMSRSGHSPIKARMRELGAPLAGDASGHFFFQERWLGFDDASYAAARLLEILSRAPDAAAVLRALPGSCVTPEWHWPCAASEARALVAQWQAQAPSFFGAEATCCTLDGLRVDWPDGFGLVRASNTTAVLTLRFEGHTPHALARIQRRLRDFLQGACPDLVWPAADPTLLPPA